MILVNGIFLLKGCIKISCKKNLVLHQVFIRYKTDFYYRFSEKSNSAFQSWNMQTYGVFVDFFSKYYKVDLFVFMKMDRYKNSPGVNMKNLGEGIIISALSRGNVSPFYHRENGIIFIAVVDPDTGNVLWANYKDLKGNMKEYNIRTKTKQLLSKMPKFYVD